MSKLDVSALAAVTRNLNTLGQFKTEKALAQGINRAAGQMVNRTTRLAAGRIVAGDNHKKGIPYRVLRKRIRYAKAGVYGKDISVKVYINPGRLPVIKLGRPELVMSQRRTRMNRGAGSVLHIGPYIFRGGFIQMIQGRPQVLRRTSRTRYPVDIVRIRVDDELEKAWHSELPLWAGKAGKEIGYAIAHQIRTEIKA